MCIKGRVINIQHFSVHDGPGIRTAVFLKGCPLKCRWCANPESQSFRAEPAWSKSKCIGCGGCIKSFGCTFENGLPHFGTDFAFSAEAVNSVCPGGALHIIGTDMTAEAVVDLCERDKPFFGAEGGITVTGGEPLAQPDFTAAILQEAHRRGLNTAIETCGFAPQKHALQAAALADTYLTDIKCITEALHLAQAGASNRSILENLKAIAAQFPEKPILVRTPIIPGFNDSEYEIVQIAEFLRALPGKNIRWELLRYHRLGLPKYESLGRAYPMGESALAEEIYSQLHTAAKKLFANTI